MSRTVSVLSTRGLARFSAERPWLIVASWAALFVVSLGIVAALLDDVLTTQWSFLSNPEYEQGRRLLEDRLRGPEHATETVVVRSSGLTVDDSEFGEFVQGLTVELIALGPDLVLHDQGVPQVLDPFMAPVPDLVSEDRRTALIVVRMAGDIDEASRTIEALHEVVDRAGEKSGFSVLVTGDATVSNDFIELSQDDLVKGETIGIPIALIVLLLIFGSVVASLIPTILGLLSIVVALGAASLFGLTIDLTVFVTNMVAAMGLAVGIDYSLFVLERYREERRRGLERLDAIERAGPPPAALSSSAVSPWSSRWRASSSYRPTFS